jgi:hypothetical protein
LMQAGVPHTPAFKREVHDGSVMADALISCFTSLRKGCHAARYDQENCC